MRIREGDPLEIYTDRDGEVIFKKYSPVGELATFAVSICDTLYKTCGATALITDRDTIIAASGPSKRELLEKRISTPLEHIIESRQIYRKKRTRQHTAKGVVGYLYFFIGVLLILVSYLCFFISISLICCDI